MMNNIRSERTEYILVVPVANKNERLKEDHDRLIREIHR